MIILISKLKKKSIFICDWPIWIVQLIFKPTYKWPHLHFFFLEGFYYIEPRWTSFLHQTPETNKWHHWQVQNWSNLNLRWKFLFKSPFFLQNLHSLDFFSMAKKSHKLDVFVYVDENKDGWACLRSVYDKHTSLTAITMISSAFPDHASSHNIEPLCWDSSPNPKPPRMRRSNQSAVSYCRIKDINWYEEFPLTPCGLAPKPRCTGRDFNRGYRVQVFCVNKIMSEVKIKQWPTFYLLLCFLFR